MKIRMVIIHDVQDEITSLKRLFRHESYEVVAFPLKMDVRKNVLPRDIDLILFYTPSLTPAHLQVVEQVCVSAQQVPVVVLTKHTSSTDIVKYLESGIDEYLVMPLSSQELVARLKALLRRTTHICHEVLSYSDVQLDTLTRVVRRGTHEIELSPTEYELLVLFLRRPHQVFTHEMILQCVWGADFVGTTAVVEVYIGYLRAKLEAHGEPRLIQTVRGVGYVLKEKGKE